MISDTHITEVDDRATAAPAVAAGTTHPVDKPTVDPRFPTFLDMFDKADQR